MPVFDLHFKQFKENRSQMVNFACLPWAFSNFLSCESRRHALFSATWLSPAVWVGCNPPPGPSDASTPQHRHLLL